MLHKPTVPTPQPGTRTLNSEQVPPKGTPWHPTQWTHSSAVLLDSAVGSGGDGGTMPGFPRDGRVEWAVPPCTLRSKLHLGLSRSEACVAAP